ncbi:hypothetical protein JCM33374_g3707 [Metschnikowia sp. JCM 33374]|nr:hypothetical protein JCM33374_g3707 [Metschnikowia sp. JCM 33374]
MTKAPLKEYLKGLPGHKILRQVARLNLISGDSNTAFKLPSNVKKLEVLIMNKAVNRRMVGLNQFWKWNLPTLRFHNDNVDFVVTRIKPEVKEEYPRVPCAIFIHKKAGDVTRIECNDRSASWIVKSIVNATGAQVVPKEEIPHIPLPKVRLQ